MARAFAPDIAGLTSNDPGPVAHMAKMAFLLGFAVVGVQLFETRGDPA
jgi:hypothetical protein